MITALFISILSSLLSVLPTASALPSGIDSAISYFIPVWSQINYILPVDTLFSLIAFAIVFEASIFAFDFINFIYNKVRGSG